MPGGGGSRKEKKGVGEDTKGPGEGGRGRRQNKVQ